MPELPEVESVRRSVEPLIAGRAVLAARLFRRDILVAPGDPAGGFSRQRAARADASTKAAAVPLRPKRLRPTDLLAGATILRVDRRGKHLALITRPPDQIALGVHLGMTGHLEFIESGRDLPRSHVHASWTFKHGILVFRDPRRFGGLRVFRSLDDLNEHWAALGPDALTITDADLHERLRASDRAIKAALLDQGVLAGVGNIYADEALFAARIHPARLASALKSVEVARLSAAIRSVLADALLAGGSTLRDYTDAHGRPGSYQDAHAVYGRSGEPCTVCGTRLTSAVLAQRTTVWCPQCQPRTSRG